MLKEAIISFRDNFKEKSRNPFWGTFAIIWFIQNWVLIYSLFNFSEDLTLQDRLDYINKYFEQNSLLSTTFDTIWITFVALIVSYILLNLSRLIINFFNKVVTPYVYKLTDKGSIVLKSEHRKVRSQMVSLNDKLSQEIDKRIRIQEERDAFEEQIASLINEEEVGKAEDEIDYGIGYSDQTLLEKLKNDLENDDMVEEFENVVTKISTGKALYDSDYHEYFSKKGIIKYKSSSTTSGRKWYKYELSEIGEKLRQILL